MFSLLKLFIINVSETKFFVMINNQYSDNFIPHKRSEGEV